MSLLEHRPTRLAETVQVTEGIYLDSELALRGTRPDGPGQQAVNALAYAVEHLRYADNLVRQTGEGGI